jgi:CBS domain-containing protein
MRVQDIFTREPATCTPRTSLDVVIQQMIERNCGFIPVIDAGGSIAGVITDRDICLAFAVHRRTAAHVAAEEAMTHPAFSCLTDDDVTTALKTMRAKRVRRLPVVNRSGRLQGVLSIDDIVIAATENDEPLIADIVVTLRVICGHHELASVPV